jgi:hypothetical protein
MLQDKTKGVSSFLGDGAYDDFEFRKVLGNASTRLSNQRIRQIIPPPKNAIIQKAKKGKPLAEHLIERNDAVEYIQKHGSKQWKIEHGYHQRSLNEAVIEPCRNIVMFRYKTIFGGKFDARIIENQRTEVKLKGLILNKFTGIGMPDSYKVA